MTMAISNTRPRQSGRFAKAYAAAWTMLALLALAYMITLAVNPSVLGSWIPERSVPENNEGQRAVARFATDLTGLRQSVGEIQRDLTSLRVVVTANAVRDKELVDRIVALEERTKPAAVAEAAAPAAAPKTAVQRQAETRAQKAAERAVAATVAAEPAATIAQAPATSADALAQRFVVLNAPVASANPIATGSIAPAQGVPAPPAAHAATAFGPGAIKAATPAAPAGLEIASGPSLDALRLNWSLLADRHAAQLKSLEARYLSAAEGQPYRLLAGPIGTSDEAKRVCAQLQAKQVPCRVTGFGGNAL